MSRPRQTRAAVKQATREALIAAAAAAFAEDGLEGASLNAICARAGHTRGAFYVHFRDRDDLLVAVMDRLLGGFVDALTTASVPDDDDQPAAAAAGGDLECIVTTIAFAITAQAFPVLGGAALRFHHVLAACDRSPRVGARYRELLRQATDGVARAVSAGQRAGAIRADLDAPALAALLVTSALGLISVTELGVPVDAQAIARVILALTAAA